MVAYDWTTRSRHKGANPFRFCLGYQVIYTNLIFHAQDLNCFSIHKSQGMTINSLIVNIDRTFAPGHVYVALSRATSLEVLLLNYMCVLHLLNPQRVWVSKELSTSNIFIVIKMFYNFILNCNHSLNIRRTNLLKKSMKKSMKESMKKSIKN